ncbi:DUF4435 domain-containing protein [Xanthomonas arboricola]|uniref:DUF4435 domain-containing protein n=1 Tax=Xanthomonas arboricola pv. populi TaxID=487823 RepID=A0A2S6Z256_9XANT|nr:DUF4435 domain-containing protein [Xanthomonas arboricola]PPT74987.1 DUF4435 domain-containing protein [Xanthomonas arboricola pv. populi]RYF51847.1 MAG: DUF4435 domain-containing protein [Cytophagaceae bacterium]
MTELEWSSSALHARSIFFEEFNDIDIYVEDTDATTIRIFTTLFQRALKHLRIDTVFGLGGRNEVIKRFNHDTSNGRKRLYVIDGDFSCLIGELRQHEIPSGIFRLSRYCIENYLLDRKAFAEVAHDEDGHRSPDELLRQANFDQWLLDSSSPLLRLSLAYACSEHFELGVKTCSRPIESFYQSGDGRLDDNAIEAVIAEIRAVADAKLEAGEFDVKMEQLKNRASMLQLPHLSIPSGKGYGLPLLIRRLKWVTKSKTSEKSITMRLSRYAPIDEIATAFNFAVD